MGAQSRSATSKLTRFPELLTGSSGQDKAGLCSLNLGAGQNRILLKATGRDKTVYLD